MGVGEPFRLDHRGLRSFAGLDHSHASVSGSGGTIIVVFRLSCLVLQQSTPCDLEELSNVCILHAVGKY